jgi:hypothetical protein
MKEHTLTMQTRSFLARVVVALAVLLGGTAPLYAQTVLNTTTTTAAISTNSQQAVALTATTGVTAAGNGANLVYLLIDRELMRVSAIDTVAKVATVVRGDASSRAVPHVSGATVWVVPGAALYSAIPSGQCTRTNLAYVPYVVGASPGLGAEAGTLWDCLGVTTAGQWVNTNGAVGLPTLGSTVASTAGVIAATGTVFKVSGTAAITGITAPAGIAPGFTLAIEPTGAFTWTTATNIILAGTAVVGKILYFVWDGAKWVPSYIA